MADALPDSSNYTQMTLSDLTTEFGDFVDQFNAALSLKGTWKGNLTTMTSQSLVELAASTGTFLTGRAYRIYEDAYAETAQSDSAIRSIVQMQGLRIARYLPSQMAIELTSPFTITIPALTQITVGSSQFFARDQIQLLANSPTPVTVFQGEVKRIGTNGIGQPLQSYITDEDAFVVSDRDVQVAINGVILPKAFGGLWNYKGLPAYTDLTLPDGRALIQFGDAQFGSMPGINDTITITYAVTNGDSGNNLTLSGKAVSVEGFPFITGTVEANPTGGANEKPIVAYKNIASGSFGTYLSAVTKSQYQATVITYPGIVDAYTQAQREINPMALKWMNVIRISALTQSEWSQQQIRDFLAYCQTVTMYAPYFVFQQAIAIPRDVSIDVYAFNTATLEDVQQACETMVTNLFAPRVGYLMTNLYKSDLEQACFKAAPGMISYVIVNTPDGSMIVTAPESPNIDYTFIPGGGVLGEYVYAYSVSTVLDNGEEGPPSNWTFPQLITTTDTYAIQLKWPAVPNAASYKIWGRKSGAIGLIATVPATQTTYTDDGTITPSGDPPNTLADVPIRYNQLRSLTVNAYYSERQQRTDDTPQRKVNG